MKRIGFVESNRSGSGFDALRAARKLGLHVTFFSCGLDRYHATPRRHGGTAHLRRRGRLLPDPRVGAAAGGGERGRRDATARRLALGRRVRGGSDRRGGPPARPARPKSRGRPDRPQQGRPAAALGRTRRAHPGIPRRDHGRAGRAGRRGDRTAGRGKAGRRDQRGQCRPVHDRARGDRRFLGGAVRTDEPPRSAPASRGARRGMPGRLRGQRGGSGRGRIRSRARGDRQAGRGWQPVHRARTQLPDGAAGSDPGRAGTRPRWPRP